MVFRKEEIRRLAPKKWKKSDLFPLPALRAGGRFSGQGVRQLVEGRGSLDQSPSSQLVKAYPPPQRAGRGRMGCLGAIFMHRKHDLGRFLDLGHPKSSLKYAFRRGGGNTFAPSFGGGPWVGTEPPSAALSPHKGPHHSMPEPHFSHSTRTNKKKKQLFFLFRGE